MARYIDADFLIEQLQPAKNSVWNKNDHSKSMSEMIEDFCTELKNAPTADVVPKSEVDEIVRQWKEEENCWQNNYITELRANEQIKAEVAREIFEELDKRLDKVCIVANRETEYNSFIGVVQQVFDAVGVVLSELKKKYTEDA